MPPNSELEPGSPIASILLVEEYDALAVAIGSALRKFAPRHERRVAASFETALKCAETIPFELLIIDLDPPQPGLIAFFESLRSAQPSLRVLGIGCGTSAKYAAARADGGCVWFLEKPFELTQFGTAVQTLLARDDDAEPPRRKLCDLDVADVIAIECVNAGQSVLSVRAASGQSGELHFSDGQLVHAAALGLTGAPALEEMLRWTAQEYSEADRPRDAPRSIQNPWDSVLTSALQKTSQHVRPREKPRPRTRPRVSQTGKKIVVIDDTELLLIFVDEILSANDPELRISTAHTGTEGCRRAELTAPDLILLDYSLPDINGDEVCRRLLENEKTALIPIIMMSGHVPEMVSTAQRYANVVATIAKPFLSHELVTLVGKTLTAGPRAVLEEVVAVEPAPLAAPPVEIDHQSNGHSHPPTTEILTTELPAPQDSPSPEVADVDPRSSQEEISASAIEEDDGLASAAPPSQLPAMTDSREVESAAETSSIAQAVITAAISPRELRTSPEQLPSPDRNRERRPAIDLPVLAVPLPTMMTVLLGFSLHTNAVDLTPSFQIGRIRAAVRSATVSLSLPPESAPLPTLLQTGFDMENVSVDAHGQIQTVRLIPTRRALPSAPIESRLAIGGVQATRGAVKLTSSARSAMSLQLLGAFQIAAVELSATFEVARLVLHAISRRVRVTLDGSGVGGTGVIFQIAAVERDDDGRLKELELEPL